MTWVYAKDATAALERTSELQRAKKRLPLRWFKRAVFNARTAGEAGARARRAAMMFDLGAAQAALDAFVDEHAPETLAVPPDATDAQIVDKARRIAGDVQLRTLGLEAAEAVIAAAVTCSAYGVALPDVPDDDGKAARLKCELWWRRQLRKGHVRGLEASNVRLHYVHYKRDPYASDDAVRRRLAQNRRNAAMLERVVMENEDGQRYTLAELAATSIANKALRRGELMTRLRGLEELADAAGFAGVMFTLTCPSRFHAIRQLGQAKWEPNPKHDTALTARDGQAYLRKVWARVRAACKRLGIVYFGMRVAEPHHDSTPHWHGLVFADKVDVFCAVMRKHGLRDSGDEPGAQERRVKFELIDKAKGSAVGYVAKYISKNIDGAHVGEHKTAEGYIVQPDMFDDEEITPSQRVEAWAATWGIRQFQQFGGAPVGVWRELRRVKEEALPDDDENDAAPVVRAAWNAAQKTGETRADWASYSRAMGGVAGEARRVAIHNVEVVRAGRYGDVSVNVPQGVVAHGVATVIDGLCRYQKEAPVYASSTRHQWRVVSRRGEAPSTRTRVNNCTEGTNGRNEGGRTRPVSHPGAVARAEGFGGGGACRAREAVARGANDGPKAVRTGLQPDRGNRRPVTPANHGDSRTFHDPRRV